MRVCTWLSLTPHLPPLHHHICTPQVLLDGVIRKLDRRRRVLLWRIAAMEGASSDDKVRVWFAFGATARRLQQTAILVAANGAWPRGRMTAYQARL